MAAWHRCHCVAWLLVWCLFQGSLVDAYCEGTVYFNTAGATGVKSVTIHAHPFVSSSFVTTSPSILAGAEIADGGIGADGDYLCFFVIATPALWCMIPSLGAASAKILNPLLPPPFPPFPTTGFRLQSRLQVLYKPQQLTFDRAIATDLTLHTLKDEHDGTYSDPGSDSDQVRTYAFALVPHNDTFTLLYNKLQTELQIDSWRWGEGEEPNADFASGTPFGSNPVRTLAYAQNFLYAFGDDGTDPYLSRIYIGTKDMATQMPLAVYLPSRFSNPVNLDFSSTSRQCEYLLMAYNHTDHSELGFWHPLTLHYESIYNTSVGKFISTFTWSNVTLALMPPVEAPPPIEVPISPPPSNPPIPPLTCAPPFPQPETAFYCDLETLLWTANATSLSTSPITLSNPIVVLGNLDATETITFQGLGSTLNVTGCINLQDAEIELVLTEQEVKELEILKTKTNLLITANCSTTSLQDTQFSINAKPTKKCHRISGETAGTGNTLSVVLRFNGSKCNVWWIIVASVVGGLVVIAVIAVILLATFHKGVKAKMRPYWARQKQPEGATATS